MRKISILTFALLFASAVSFAQDGKKALKDASRALSSFNLGGANDGEKLQEAIDAVDIAVEDAEIGATSKAWLTRGKIYNTAIDFVRTQSILVKEGEEAPKLLDEAAAIKVYESYRIALEKAIKGWEKKDALKGLSECMSDLNGAGYTAYQEKDYKSAYKQFNYVIEAHELLKENDQKSSLDAEGEYDNQLYTAATAALGADKQVEAATLFEKLIGRGYKQAGVYDALYKINKDKDIDKALGFLNEGREAFPDDVGLLFTEINYYLSAGQMDILEDRLKKAIAKEPNNPSLYYTLGRVYADVSDAKKEEEDEAAAKDYFNKAIEQFNMALEKKDDFYEAWYGIGEMYYNEAAVISKVMQGLDISEQKRYGELDLQMKDLFDKALPYFQKAEQMNPNDRNTLVALSEIYARKNDFDKVKEFKDRIEQLNAGN